MGERNPPIVIYAARGGRGGNAAVAPGSVAGADKSSPTCLAQQASGLCRHHWRYGDKAFNCCQPCSWQGNWAAGGGSTLSSPVRWFTSSTSFLEGVTSSTHAPVPHQDRKQGGQGVGGQPEATLGQEACPAGSSPPPRAAQDQAGRCRCRAVSHLRGSRRWWGPLCSGPAL